jgi:hypothetical protein
VEAADHHLAALRVAAEDAVDIDPMMSPLVLYSEVHTHGPALADQLFALRREIDFLAEALSGGQHHVS